MATARWTTITIARHSPRRPWARSARWSETRCTVPGQHFLDLSLVKSFRFNGSHRIEARIESFNALNWFQWNNPQNNFNNVQFGRITSAGDPRIMQFAIKYQF